MNSYQLPWWMQWLQAIAIIGIAGLGARIAYKQAIIAEGKLKLDLFEKRFKVFDAARNALVEVFRNGDIRTKDLDEYDAGVLDAVFLFNEEIESYLEGLRKEMAGLYFINRQLERAGDDDKKRAKYADAASNKLTALTDELQKLKERFKPFLKLGLQEDGPAWQERINAALRKAAGK
jgi:uncharacterized protein (DUF4415 family)